MPKQTLKKANKRSTHLDSRAKRAEQGKLVYKIDCSIPCSDELIDAETMKKFEAYITENLKINGKTGQLGNKVKITLADNQILITKFQVLFAKRYLKFLTRKFLKREKLRDYFRPVSSAKHDYQLRYYNIDLGDDVAEE
eukprot:TRINITY_DN1308_c0_g1_i5.p1 TRINITY_DN1308_c0_g1~~TRINITY_DN1308_c0_g1_i5.p1  ORF type:complete len:139 (+),score=34.98 TRINITY_DN1308_c0_g1_i5:96-512(+)